MTRYVIGALLLMTALFGVGYRLRAWLWADDQLPSAAAHATLPAAVEPEREPGPIVELTALTGRVEVRDAPGEAWHTAAQSAKLDADGALRTDEGASVRLTIGTAVQMDLSERSQFTLSEVTHGLSNVRLESGRVAARLMPDAKSRVRLEVLGNDAVAEMDAGAFTAMRADDGQVTVAATNGTLSLATKHQKLDVSAGYQSVVPATGEPTAPVRIPSSLFLKLAQSARQQLNRHETSVTGTTTPGAVVMINGVPALTDRSGEFTARVPLQEGGNTLRVRATDALGRTQERVVNVDVDTQAPKLGSKVVW